MTALIVDGNSIGLIAYYGNGHFEFVNMLDKARKQIKANHIYICFDNENNFRKNLLPSYKANRQTDDPQKVTEKVEREFYLQTLQQGLKLNGFQVFSVNGYEADDLVASLVHWYNNDQCYIFTGDQDAFQLVNDRVKVIYRNPNHIVDSHEVKRMVGIEPYQVPDFKAIAGDTSDNISGIDGLGKKRAGDLLREWGSLEGIRDNLDQITNKWRIRDKLILGLEQAFWLRDEIIKPYYTQVDCTLEPAPTSYGQVVKYIKETYDNR